MFRLVVAVKKLSLLEYGHQSWQLGTTAHAVIHGPMSIAVHFSPIHAVFQYCKVKILQSRRTAITNLAEEK
jgi:hypothetical protein